jgi:hypothetical protein
MEILKQKQERRRNCLCCKESYILDARNRWHQNYCSKLECRKASKKASQARWLSSDKGRGYFQGAINVNRVKEWRASHPGYWKGKKAQSEDALQDVFPMEDVVNKGDAEKMTGHALQDVLTSQPALLIGLIATMTGYSLQDDIAEASRRFVVLGQDILGVAPENKSKGGFHDVDKTHSMSGTSSADTRAVQLGGSSSGAR